MDERTRCGCNYSLAVICGLFTGIGVALYLAQDRCLDGGGRVSNAAWSCEGISGAASSLWELVTPGITAVVVFAGILVFLAVAAFGRRWLFRYGKHHG